MKKLISILLVAMLIIGMFPATALTAFAEDTVVATFTLAPDGTATHADGSSATTYTETQGDYTLSITGGSSMYTKARDAKGNGCIKLGTGSKAGSFTISNVPADVTSVVIYVAKYKANAATVTINGTATVLDKNSNDGAYNAITVDTSSTKTVSLSVTNNKRAMVNTIEFIVAGGSSEPDCEHTDQVAIGEAKDATCTEDGITAGVKCADCDYVIEEQETLPATGHNYVDGACSVCGAEQPNEVEATISFATEAQRVSQDGNSQVWANEGITFTNNKAASTNAVVGNVNPVRLYANSELVFEAPGAILEILVDCNSSSYATALTNSITTGATVTVASDKVTIIPTASANTFTVAKLSAQTRFDSLTITYAGASASECEHTDYELQNAAVATCTENGYTGDKYCRDCESVFEYGQTIPATNHEGTTNLDAEAVAGTCQQEGTAAKYSCSACNATWGGESTGLGDHNYVDGACSLCDEAEPSEQTINFATADQRVSLDTESQVWKNGNVTFTNNKGTGSNVADYTNPARFYKNSQLVIVASSNITKIVFNCNTEDYATELKNSIGNEATVDGKVVTLIPTEAATTYTIAALTGQVRIDSVTVSYAVAGAEPECTHENKVSNEDAQAPTCVNPGQTDSYTCPDCGETIDAEPIPATGEHNYVDGACTMCGAGEPERYYIAAYRDSEDKYYYLTSDLEDNKRYQAVAANILPSNIDPDAVESNYVFLLTDNGNGTFYLQAENVTGNNYLTHTGTSNTGTYASLENAPKLTVDITDKGYYNIHFTSDEERYLSLNGTRENNFFAWYKGTQKQDLVLIPIEEAEDMTATLYGDVDGLTVTGDLTLDLNGHMATNVTAGKIYACDTSYVRTEDSEGKVTFTEGTGLLTVTEGVEVVTDNKVDGVRYIALKDEADAYTFHVLELKLSAISLRASQAGIYYKAIMNCDDTLKGATDYHGMVVSVNNMPGADFGALTEEEDNNCFTKVEGAPAEGNMTSCAVFGIFKVGKDNAARGEMKIYANAYLQLNETNGSAVIMADTTADDKVGDEGFNGIAWSLRDVMEAVDTTFNSLDVNNEEQAKQRQTILNFYNKWAPAMDVEGNEWAIGNIRAAATPAE